MDNAAGNGYLEVVKWLHTNRTEGCTTNALNFAAWGGQLEVMKWLWENRTEGCTTKAIDYAVKHYQVSVVRWLLFNTTAKCSPPTMNSFTHEAIENAVRRGNIAVASWLLHNFPDLATTNVDFPHDRCSFDMLLLLREHCPCVFTKDFIWRNVKSRLWGDKSAHEMDAIGWLLSQFPGETRWAIMWEGPDDLLSHLLE